MVGIGGKLKIKKINYWEFKSMNIIEKIEIKHFRSFLGSPQNYNSEIVDLKDLNIFSGANDSGKSNILRALNLFFNDEIAPETKFDFDRDFSIGKQRQTQKVIEIAITFNLPKKEQKDFLPQNFTVSKFYDRWGFRNYLYTFKLKKFSNKEIKIDSRSENNTKIFELFLPEDYKILENDEKERIMISAQKKEARYRAKFSGFIKSTISYEYVPAIRDASFFSNLCGRVITTIKNKEDNRIKDLMREKSKIENYTRTIKNKSENKEFVNNLKNEQWRANRIKVLNNELNKKDVISQKIKSLESEINKSSEDFLKSVDIKSEFKVGSDLQDFFEGFDIGTGADKAISFKLRGDGIQAKYVPKMLDFLSQKSSSKYYIWGFEEPENSSERKNQKKLAEDLKNIYSENKQIFITTHSEEFLSLYDDSHVDKNKRNANLYHVMKFTDSTYGEYSKVYMYDANTSEFQHQQDQLVRELGISSYVSAKYSKELKDAVEEFLKGKESLEQQNKELKEILNKGNCIILTEGKTDTQLLRIAWKNLYPQKKCNFIIEPRTGVETLRIDLLGKAQDKDLNKKVIGIFDNDSEGNNKFNSLKDYFVEYPFDNCQIKKSKNNSVYAILLPIPNGREIYVPQKKSKKCLEIEHFFDNETLKKYFGNNSFQDCDYRKNSSGSTIEILEIPSSKQQFADAIDRNCKDINFSNFKILFDILEKLLAIC